MLHHPQLQIVSSVHSWPNFNKNAVEEAGDSVLDFSVWVTRVCIKCHMGRRTIAGIIAWICEVHLHQDDSCYT